MDIQTCLTEYRLAEYQQLGRKSGFFLSYEGKNGWRLLNLNPFQQLFRLLFSCCGAYASTHPKTIVKQLQKEVGAPPELMRKIQGSWDKAYPMRLGLRGGGSKSNLGA